MQELECSGKFLSGSGRDVAYALPRCLLHAVVRSDVSSSS